MYYSVNGFLLPDFVGAGTDFLDAKKDCSGHSMPDKDTPTRMPSPGKTWNDPVGECTGTVKIGPNVRTFSTGATRSPDHGRPDYEGYLSSLVLERYGEYMLKHQIQSDGTIRTSDNWQKSMPLGSYIKGAFRHFMHWWQRHRGWPVKDPRAAADIEEDICALIFNCQGYLHEILKRKQTTNEEA